MMDAVNFDQNSSLENDEEAESQYQERTFKAEDIKGELEQKSLKHETKYEDNHVKVSLKVSKERLLDHHKALAKELSYEPQAHKKLHTEVVAQKSQETLEPNHLERQINHLEEIINKNTNLIISNGNQAQQHQPPQHQTQKHQTQKHQTPQHQTPQHQTPQHQTSQHQTFQHQTQQHQTQQHQTQYQAVNSNKGFQVVNPGFIHNNSLNQSQFLMQHQPSMNMPILLNNSQLNNPMLSANHFGANGQLMNVMPQQNYVIRSNNTMMPMFMYPNQMQNKSYPTMNLPQNNFTNAINGSQDSKLSNNDHHLSKLMGNSNSNMIQTPMPYYIPNMQLQPGMQSTTMNGIQVIPTLMYVFTAPQSSNFQGYPQGLNQMCSQNMLFNGTNHNMVSTGNQCVPVEANLPSVDHFGYCQEKMVQKNVGNLACNTVNGQGQSSNEWDRTNMLQYMLEPAKRIIINSEK